MLWCIVEFIQYLCLCQAFDHLQACDLCQDICGTDLMADQSTSPFASRTVVGKESDRQQSNKSVAEFGAIIIVYLQIANQFLNFTQILCYLIVCQQKIKLKNKKSMLF